MSTSENIDPGKFNLRRAVYSKQETAELLSVCLRTVDNLVKGGKLAKPVKIGRDNRYYARDLAKFLASLEVAA